MVFVKIYVIYFKSFDNDIYHIFLSDKLILYEIKSAKLKYFLRPREPKYKFHSRIT